MNQVYDYFSGYISSDDLVAIGYSEIVSLKVRRAERVLELGIRSNVLIDRGVIDSCQRSLAASLELNKAIIDVYYDSSLFRTEDIERILEPVCAANPIVNGFFDGVTAELEGDVLTLSLKKGGKSILESQDMDRIISKYISDKFGLQYSISFFEAQAFDIEKAVREATAKQEAIKKKEKEEKQKVFSTKLLGDTPLYADTRKVVFGRAIKELPKPINQVSPDDGFITVWGDVFATDVRDTKRGDSKIFTFSITDYTSSLTVKMFDKNAEVDPVIKSIGKSGTFIISGSYQYDKFSNEFVLRPNNIESVIKSEKTDDAPEKRVELHMHTVMSEMDAINSAKELVTRAAKWGHRAVAITDHGVVQSLPEAYAAAKANGIKLILGVEGYLVDDGLYPDFMNMKMKEFRRHHIILLVKADNSMPLRLDENWQPVMDEPEDGIIHRGRKNLYELISHSNVKTFKSRPLIPKSLLAQKRDDILIGSACEQGEIIQAILRGEPQEEIERLAEFYDYLEIQPNGNNRFMIASTRELHENINSEEDLININKQIIRIADKQGKPVVATGDVHFLDEKDAKFRAVIMASKGFEDADNQAPLYFKTTDEMLKDFAWAGDRAKEFVIDNPNKIADMIQDNIPPIPPGTYQPFIQGADDELTDKCWNTAKELYGDPVPEYVASRLERELQSIIGHGYGVLYVIAKRLVEESERRGYLVGSRGSVGSSLAAHFGGISEVNPLAPHYYCKQCKHSEFFLNGEYGSGFDLPPKNCPVCGTPMKRDGHEIPFETFLGFDGDKEPDIDLNFSGEVQGQIHRFTETLFGKEYVFKAGTMATVADRTAYGYVCKYLEERGLYAVTPRAEIDRLTIGCTGIKRTTGQHPGGMVVVPDKYSVEDFTPIQYPSNDEKKGTYTTHFDFKNSLHDTLLKLDELGHDNPTLYKYLEDSTGIPVMDVDLSDPKLYQLVTSCDPLGVSPEDIDNPTGTLAIPEMGTPFVVGMLTEAKPKTFADLLQISGLSHGTDVWLGNAQELITKGTCTISEVIGCRDDIMTHLIHVAEAYEKRTGNKSPLSKKDCFKIMEYTRKGKAPKELPPYEDAMKTIGVEQWYIDSCYKIKYMFPKAHAAAYVIAALRIAWYKIYYPLQFYSAYFTVRGGAIDAVAAVQGKAAVKQKMNEIKLKGNDASQKEKDQYVVLQIVIEMLARGYEFLPVDLEKSDWRIYKIEDGKIRLPFSAIDGIGETAAQAIAAAVERNPEGFVASDDLAGEPGVGKSVVDALRSAGALGNLPESKQIAFF
ncbi:MAG: PolC-type DNA polymerase III [Eubacteriales bacterium]|nr:PolC-type DNA polymerase III [Eubacteriales bacterium]